MVRSPPSLCMHVWSACMSVCVHICAPWAFLLPTEARRVSDPLELELEADVGSHVGAGNQNQGL